MSGIEELIELYRGEAPSRSQMNFGTNRGTYFTPQKDFAKHIARGGSMTSNNLIRDLFGKVKSLKIPQELYKTLGGNSFEVNIRDPQILNTAKTDILQTFLAKAGSLSPLAIKGLNMIASLPVATISMLLTPTRMGNAEATLEDFAMLANKEKEGIETIDIGDM